jgi:predicted ATPase
MLTQIQIRNFKKLESVNFELGKSVVLIGPNNSGKTTALQALALWDIGLRRWNEKRGGKTSNDHACTLPWCAGNKDAYAKSP